MAELEIVRKVSSADIKVRVNARIKAAYDKKLAMIKPEVAEIQDWWNIFAYGPIQAIAPEGPFAPHQIIKVGEPAYVVAVMVLNPFLQLHGGISPAHVLSDFSLPYEVKFETANISTWAKSPISATLTGNLNPGQAWYTEVLEFTANQEGIHEMNILARIKGAVNPGTAPHFAGFARWVGDLDPESLWPPSGATWHFELPVKFMVYA